MILAEIQYKAHDQEFPAIIEIFKTRRYYLKSCKYKVLVFTKNNNFC